MAFKVRKRREDLQSQLIAVEQRVDDQGKYTEQLVAAIDVMRHRRSDFLIDRRAQEARSLKVEKDLKQLQAYVSDELNLRERAVRQLRRGREEVVQERLDSEQSSAALSELSTDLERRTELCKVKLDKLEQSEKQADWAKVRGERVKKERAGVRFGYTRNQVDGWRVDFEQMGQAARVRFNKQLETGGVAGREGTFAAQLVAVFQSNEARNDSLLGRLTEIVDFTKVELTREIGVLGCEEADLEKAAILEIGGEKAALLSLTNPATELPVPVEGVPSLQPPSPSRSPSGGRRPRSARPAAADKRSAVKRKRAMLTRAGRCLLGGATARHPCLWSWHGRLCVARRTLEEPNERPRHGQQRSIDARGHQLRP